MLTEAISFMSKSGTLHDNNVPTTVLECLNVIDRHWDIFKNWIDPTIKSHMPRMKRFATDFERFKVFRLGTITRGDLIFFLENSDKILEFLKMIDMNSFLEDGRVHLSKMTSQL
jgi:hypothetical protein